MKNEILPRFVARAAFLDLVLQGMFCVGKCKRGSVLDSRGSASVMNRQSFVMDRDNLCKE